MKKYLIIIIGLFLFMQPVYAESNYETKTNYNESINYNLDHIDSNITGYITREVLLYPFMVFIVIILAIIEGKSKLSKKTTSKIKEEAKKIEDSIENIDHKTPSKNNTNYNKIIGKYLKGYNEKRLLDDVYEIFVIIEKAYMNYEYGILEEYCSNELYEEYKTDLDELKKENCKNIMSDFKLKSKAIRNIEEKNNRVEIDVFMEMSFYDYIIDQKTGEVVFGNKFEAVTNCYDLEYIIDLDGIDKCPNCGAELTSRRCDYCASTVDKKNTSLVLNKKSIMHK